MATRRLNPGEYEKLLDERNVKIMKVNEGWSLAKGTFLISSLEWRWYH